VGMRVRTLDLRSSRISTIAKPAAGAATWVSETLPLTSCELVMNGKCGLEGKGL
jgi:hypothetical protein